MKAIYERELQAYFQGLSGYIFGTFILLFAGIYIMVINLANSYANFEYVLQSMSFIYLLVIPVLSMRVLAEERRQKTDQLLYSLPLGMPRIVLGKYLAMVTVLLVPVLIMCFYPLVLALYGTVNLKVAYTALLGFFLLGAALLAIGMFISSLTENQVVAAVGSFIVVLLNYFISDLAYYISSTAAASFIALTLVVVGVVLLFRYLTKNNLASLILLLLCEVALILVLLLAGDSLAGFFPSVLAQLALFERFNSLAQGIMDFKAVLYFLTVTAGFVFLTLQALEKRRWS